MADVGVLPGSGGPSLDKAGIKNEGYLTKKGTPSGKSAMFNALPPGSNIDDQALADIRELPYKEVVSKSYPGDGWT
jgi:hypothetical protein